MSLVAATVVAAQPGFLLDLLLVRTWLDAFAAGTSPYLLFQGVDYPPNAFVLLAPLHWIPEWALLPVYAPFAIGATAVASWWTTGWLSDQVGVKLSNRDRALLVMMMLAGSSMRSAIWRGQMAPLAFLFGAAALRYSTQRPWLAAAGLACCAFKPHVALAFALVILVTTGVAILLQSGVMVLAMSGVFGLATGQSISASWRGYADALAHVYAGPDRVRGLLSVRWVMEDLTASDSGTLLYIAAALISGALLLDAALRRTDRGTRTRVAAGLMLWCVLFLPHQLYHGWLAAPAVWLLMWPEAGLITTERLRVYVVSIFVTVGVVDVPRLLRWLVDPDGNWTIGWISYAMSPLRLAFLFAVVMLAVRRPLRQPPADIATAA